MSTDAREQALVEAATPVRAIPGDDQREGPEPGVALCLSGGGFRAMLFHLGALTRLNELGWLKRLDRISSVSGGSITAGVLAHRWDNLSFDGDDIATNLGSELVDPIRAFAGRTVDIGAGLKGAFLPGSIADQVANSYDEHFFGGATLQHLPDDPPRFVINATNLQSGVLWRFSKPYAWDYRVGKIEHPELRLAVAVAASSAFPPFLSPLTLKFDDRDYVPGTGTDLQRSEYMQKPVLSDGGVYDNLGLETAWKRYQTILVSDGGGHFAAKSRIWTNWPVQAQRVLGVIDGQVRDLRKRQAIGGLKAKLRQGAYWSIWSETADFRLADPLDCPDTSTKKLAAVPTRLGKMDSLTQRRLINWGYAICDTALRKHVLPPGTARPTDFPYPEAGV